MAAVVASSLVFSWAFGDLPFSRKFDAGLFSTPSRYELCVRQLVRITPDARVSAESSFPAHLAERRYVYDYAFEGVQDAEWVVLDYEAANYDLAAFNAQVAAVEGTQPVRDHERGPIPHQPFHFVMRRRVRDKLLSRRAGRNWRVRVDRRGGNERDR